MVKKELEFTVSNESVKITHGKDTILLSHKQAEKLAIAIIKELP